MSKQRENPKPAPGDALRDQAADLLASIYGSSKTENRTEGKKVDVYFERREFGKSTRFYVEAKDYDRNLRREELVSILTDYSGILRKHAPSTLLVVTRQGLTTDAQKFVDEEIDNLVHQTIWEVETGLINLDAYLRYVAERPTTSGLAEYYVPSGFTIRRSVDPAHLSKETATSKIFDTSLSALSQLTNWAKTDCDGTPVAVLGGYGSGKTSLADMLASKLAGFSLFDPHARQPVLIRLGGISQYSSIEGLLAGYFTNEFPVPNFNCPNFLNLNSKGRYVLILDGFDEMKHSMSWSSFKSQVRNLLKLHGPRSKILLLGRPSAFLSEAEDRYILKGERPVGDVWTRLPDWPQFHELELSDFTAAERESFVRGYLGHMSGNHSGFDPAKRARTTNEIADMDPSLFKKPVHSKILTDLATDPNFDLKKFGGRSSRWILYSEFLSSIYDRETEKTERQQISATSRLSFLRELSFWLWSQMGTQISFSVEQIPDRLYGDMLAEDPENKEGISREFLSGSILDKKSGNVFFFGHRSFAEFLVADRMLKNAPSAKEHEAYSLAFVDGVRTFIEDSGNEIDIHAWIRSFSHASGEISQNYIDFLAGQIGCIDELCENVTATSEWRYILKPFKNSLAPTSDNYSAVIGGLKREGAVAWAWHYLWLVQRDAEFWANAGQLKGRGNSEFDTEVISNLLHSLFSQVQCVGRNLWIEGDLAGLRKICHEAVTAYESETGDYVRWSHAGLINACERELYKAGHSWDRQIEVILPAVTTTIADLTRSWQGQARGNLDTFIKHVRSWNSITERAQAKKSREVSRQTKPLSSIRRRR